MQGFDFRHCCQSPNIRDFNVIDLGFFDVIQSLQDQSARKNIDVLIEVVENAFTDPESTKLNYVFLALQQCRMVSMEINRNNYKIPHIGNDHLDRGGGLLLVG